MRIENSFIPVRGVGEATERRLWSAGITHWDEFEDSTETQAALVGDTLADRIRQFIDEGRRQLSRGDVSYFAETFPSKSRWRLYENVKTETCFLDIETTGLDATRDVVTTVSLYRGGDVTTFVRGRDLTADRLRTELEAASLLVTFNGKRFDVPFLESRYDLEVTTPHVDLLYPCRRLGLTGGLKVVEQDLGIDRSQPDISGRDAIRLWREYERGDERALDTLVQYNRADTKNLKPVMDVVTETLHERVFETACDIGQNPE